MPRAQAAKTFTEMANEVTAGAAAVEQIALETPELKALGDRYLSMCAASAAAFRGMVAATHAVDHAQQLVDQGDPAGQAAMSKANAQAAQAQATMQQATDPELEIVKGLNKVCDSE
jgi:phage gp45-like